MRFTTGPLPACGHGRDDLLLGWRREAQTESSSASTEPSGRHSMPIPKSSWGTRSGKGCRQTFSARDVRRVVQLACRSDPAAWNERQLGAHAAAPSSCFMVQETVGERRHRSLALRTAGRERTGRGCAGRMFAVHRRQATAGEASGHPISIRVMIATIGWWTQYSNRVLPVTRSRARA